MKTIFIISQLALVFFGSTVSQGVYAKWDEERDMTTNGKEELVYYYKTNDQGQKLFLAKKVEFNVLYGRDEAVSTFQIK